MHRAGRQRQDAKSQCAGCVQTAERVDRGRIESVFQYLSDDEGSHRHLREHQHDDQWPMGMLRVHGIVIDRQRVARKHA